MPSHILGNDAEGQPLRGAGVLPGPGTHKPSQHPGHRHICLYLLPPRSMLPPPVAQHLTPHRPTRLLPSFYAPSQAS